MERSKIKIALTRALGSFRLQVDLSLPGQGISILFGPSGCGKTSLLRGIAGLDAQMQGHVSVNGQVWLDSSRRKYTPAWQRAVGFVFQDAALFPHLSVKENLIYGMKRAGGHQESGLFDHISELLALDGLHSRHPDSLSGGERQRVAIGRALLSKPQLLLMDEPLSSLDESLKREFLPYLDRLHRELDIPVIYVTHAHDELMRLADYVVLMAEGRVDDSGTLEALLPILGMKEGLCGEWGTVVAGMIRAHQPEDGVSQMTFQGGSLWLPLLALPEGSSVRCRILPSDVSLSIERPTLCSILNVMPVTVVSILEQTQSAQILVCLDLEGTVLYSSVTRKSAKDLALSPGQIIYAQIKTTTLMK